MSSWTDIVAIAAGDYHTVGLRSNGTVVVAGDNSSECKTGDWTDIIAISAGKDITVGLKKDGSIIYAGGGTYNSLLRNKHIDEWKDNIGVAGESECVLAVRSDGMVRSSSKRYDTENWVIGPDA